MMHLTLDDCIALAARECATEHELRAALCVAVGQALHARYEARGYSEAAETAKRDADRARAESRAYSEALIAKESAPDTSDGIDYPARAEVWRLRESVAALRDERDRAVQEREAFSLRLSAAERERDEALARPTYEARTTAPTNAEADAHAAAGGEWLVSLDGDRTRRAVVMWCIDKRAAWTPTGHTWIPLGANGLPCAWPVVTSEVSP